MRILFFCSILFCSFLFISIPAGSAPAPVSNNTLIPLENIYSKIASLSIKDIQKSIGRKLTLKEKIALLILKQKRRHVPKEPMNAGDISLILGIASLAFLALYFLLPYTLIAAIGAAIVAIVTGHRTRKKDPGNKNAKIGKLLGWITVGLITGFFIAILIAFASIGSWGFG
jgi:hypothetical protein